MLCDCTTAGHQSLRRGDAESPPGRKGCSPARGIGLVQPKYLLYGISQSRHHTVASEAGCCIKLLVLTGTRGLT